MENHERYFEVFWGAQRIGLSTTPINWHLKADEAGYIIEDCGAVAVVTSARLADVARSRSSRTSATCASRLMVDGTAPGWSSYEAAIDRAPGRSARRRGRGVMDVLLVGHDGPAEGHRARRDDVRAVRSTGGTLVPLMVGMYGFTADSVYLCPAPLYHAAPFGWSTTAQRLGGDGRRDGALRRRADPRS